MSTTGCRPPDVESTGCRCRDRDAAGRGLGGTYDAGALLPQTKRNFRGSKGPFRDPTRLPWAPGGVQNHSPGKSLVKEILQNAYKTCVILTIMVFFCKILNISLGVAKKNMYYSGRFLTGHFCDT